MTLLNKYDIKCPNCGHYENIYLNDSVNIQVDPKLLRVVKARKVNNLKCSRCHTFYELIAKFLFVDMKNGKWIWVCPVVSDEEKRLFIEQLNAPEYIKMVNIINNISVAKMEIVFGYDELFDKL